MDEKIMLTTSNSYFEVDEGFDDSRFCRVHIRLMHTGLNRNNSYFSEECVENAKETFKNIPILANTRIVIDENGNEKLDYTSHDMHIEEDAFDEGKNRIVYDEKVVGIIPETNNFEMVLDEETGNKYVIVDAILYREYGNYVVDILESRGCKTSVSMEIALLDSSFDAEKKYLVVKEMEALGLTLLGEDVEPGMYGSEMEMFSLDKNNVSEQLIQIMQELKESLDNYTKISQKGGNSLMAEETNVIENEEATVDNATVEEMTTEENISEEEVFDVKIIHNDSNYSLTLGDKLKALSEVVNSIYGEVDATWYFVDADEKYVFMTDYCSERTFRQEYSENEEEISLIGDREQVFAMWLSEDEKKNVEEMLSNYSSISEKLEKFEKEPEKLAILNSSEYSSVSDKAEFVELKKQENHFDLTVEEVSSKADEIVLKYAKSGNLNFSANNSSNSNVTVMSVPIADKDDETRRYGDLFSKK